VTTLSAHTTGFAGGAKLPEGYASIRLPLFLRQPLVFADGSSQERLLYLGWVQE
jgi:hypothetical protein